MGWTLGHHYHHSDSGVVALEVIRFTRQLPHWPGVLSGRGGGRAPSPSEDSRRVPSLGTGSTSTLVLDLLASSW